jgi:hypothetical protein
VAPSGITEVAAQAFVVAFSLIFVASVLGKLDGWGRWSALASALPFPPRLREAVRLLLPVLEAGVVAVLLLFPVAGLLASSALLAIFAIAVTLIAKRIGPAECGCFGALTPTKLGTALAVRNALLASAAALGVALVLQADTSRPSLAALALGLLLGLWILLPLEYVHLSQGREERVGGAR